MGLEEEEKKKEEAHRSQVRVPGVHLMLPINSGPGWGRLHGRSNHESELQDAFQAALYCLASHMATAQTETEWVNIEGESQPHIYPGDMWESVNWIYIPGCISHSSMLLSYLSSKKKNLNHQLRSRRRNGSIWSCLLCSSISTHCLVQGCLCGWAVPQRLSVIQQSSLSAQGAKSCYPNPSALSHLTDKRLIYRVGRR